MTSLEQAAMEYVDARKATQQAKATRSQIFWDGPATQGFGAAADPVAWMMNNSPEYRAAHEKVGSCSSKQGAAWRRLVKHVNLARKATP